MEIIILLVLIIILIQNEIYQSITHKNQKFILDKIEEINNKLKSE